MTLIQDQLPTAAEAAIAKACSRELSAILETRADTQVLTFSDPRDGQHVIHVPSSALRLLVDILIELGDGNTVKLVPIHAELTTQEAADLLNMSRPSFVKLLDEGQLPFTRTGNRRKVRFADVQDYRQSLEQQRLEVLEELSALDQELGLGYE